MNKLRKRIGLNRIVVTVLNNIPEYFANDASNLGKEEHSMKIISSYRYIYAKNFGYNPKMEVYTNLCSYINKLYKMPDVIVKKRNKI
jgi:hypothetical protein